MLDKDLLKYIKQTKTCIYLLLGFQAFFSTGAAHTWYTKRQGGKQTLRLEETHGVLRLLLLGLNKGEWPGTVAHWQLGKLTQKDHLMMLSGAGQREK